MKRSTYLFACIFLSLGSIIHPRGVNAQGTITIDHKTQRFIDNVSQLDRSKYINFHGYFGPGSTDADLVSFRNTYNLASTNSGSRRFWSPLNKVDDDLAGTIPSVSNIYNGTRSVNGTVATGKTNSLMNNPNLDYTVVDISTRSLDVADYIAQSFKDEWADVPTYYEPLNEPMIHANDFYPQNKNTAQSDIIITKICEFYRDMGAAMDAVPELQNMRMIGYASAFPTFEQNNFTLWNKRYKKYIDIAGANMDGFSVHLYDGTGVNNSGGRRSGSNIEAIMDMIEAYSFEELGTVKPLAVTEYGRLVPSQSGWTSGGTVSNYEPVENSQAVRSQMHMVMSFMERGDNMMITIPFSVGKSNPFTDMFSRAALWVEQPNGSYNLTERKFFYEMWKDVKGDRVRINSSNIDVQTQAFVDGNKLYVVLNNLNDAPQTVNLDLLNQSGLQTVQTKRLKIFTNQVPQLTNSSSSSAPSSLSIAYGETVVLTYTFGSSISFTNDITRKKYYATSTLKSISANTDVTFTVNGVSKGSGSGYAKLRVGVGRTIGSNLAPTVTINNQTVSYSGDIIRGYDQNNRSDFFGTLEIPVALSLLNAGTNTVKVKFSDGGGNVSSVILEVETYTNPINSGTGVTSTFQNLGSNNYMSIQNPSQMSTVSTAGATEEFEIIDLDGGSIAGGLVALKGSNGNYVSSENGTKELTCTRTTIGGWEQFTLVEISSGVYALQGNNSQYVRDNMLCTSPNAGTWQQWTVNLSNIASFQNVGSNKYMSSSNATQMSTVTTLGTTEKFEIIDVGGGQVALKGSNGNYVSSENGTKEMTCTRTTIGGWEKFTLVDQGDGTQALLGSNGQYLRENMLCTSPSVSTWQKWNVTTGLSPRLALSEAATSHHLDVYPNPLHEGAVIVEWAEADAPYSIEIIDVRGAVVFQATGLTGSSKISRASFPSSGMYLIKANDGMHTLLEKVMVK